MENKKRLKKEKAAYENVLLITEELKKLERRVALYFIISSFAFLILFKFFIDLMILLLISVMFFGIAVTILFRRNEDLRLGGILTYPLLLCYSISNLLVFIHFFIIVLIGLPIGIWLTRRGYIGQVLFYMLALFVFPLTVLSYYAFAIYFPPITIINIIQHPGTVIYLLLPHIYLYNLMKLPKKKIGKDIMAMTFLVLAGIVFWVLILRLVGL